MRAHFRRIYSLVVVLVIVLLTGYWQATIIVTDGSMDRVARSDKEDTTSGFLSQAVLELNHAGSELPDEYVQKIAEAKEINEDVRGWITVTELGIDYPVLYSEDNSEYLRKNIYGDYDVTGCIYLDANYGNIYSPMKLIHGHNMKNGTMFANVPQMLKWDTLEDAPNIIYCDELGLKVFKIFSVYSVDSTKESVIISQYTTIEELNKLKDIYVEKSWPKVDEVPEGTELMMLNTCWYGPSGGQRNLHCIVVAGRVK